jgi:amino acid transporter
MQTSCAKVRERVAPAPAKAVGLWGALSTNVLNMVGIGPFLTIPLALAAMGGPQAMIGWILGAALSVCDGMVWAELGSAMPLEGGPYHYLLQGFGPRGWGRVFSFLFLWQSILLGPLSIASGAVGFADYTKFLIPSLHGGQLIAVAILVCVLNTFLVYRNIRSIARLSIIVAVVVFASMIWIVFAGATHFHPALAFDFPPNAFRFSTGFLAGLGSATLIAAYDYGGYYNVCLIGAEVVRPKVTIPRSILWAIAIVAVLYLVMNLAIIGVVPWREAMQSKAIVADFMDRIYGSWAGRLVAVLILIASFGSVFAVLLGYSRIPYAAARDGRFFSVFARLHPRGGFPHISVLALGVCSALACFISLGGLISALIVTQTLLQFMGQCVAVILLRRKRRETGGSYRMPLFPLPALLALGGWTYIVVTSGARYILMAFGLMLTGVLVYLLRARKRFEWPFGGAEA